MSRATALSAVVIGLSQLCDRELVLHFVGHFPRLPPLGAAAVDGRGRRGVSATNREFFADSDFLCVEQGK